MSQVNKYNAPLTGESAVREAACGFHSVNPCLMAQLNKNRQTWKLLRTPFTGIFY